MTPKTLAFSLVLATAFAGNAHATLAQAKSFDDKVENAASIVLGKCVATKSQWDPDHRWILTYSTFQVEQALKGDAPREITIVTPGGAVDGMHQETIGVPSFNPGEENVIFTKATNLGPTVLYFDQGTYDIETADRGERVVTPRPTGAVLVDTQRGAAYEPEHARPLRDFTHAVHDSMARTKAEKMELIRARQQEQSIAGILLKYKFLIALAFAGIALATWQLLRK